MSSESEWVGHATNRTVIGTRFTLKFQRHIRHLTLDYRFYEAWHAVACAKQLREFNVFFAFLRLIREEKESSRCRTHSRTLTWRCRMSWRQMRMTSTCTCHSMVIRTNTSLRLENRGYFVLRDKSYSLYVFWICILTCDIDYVFAFVNRF